MTHSEQAEMSDETNPECRDKQRWQTIIHTKNHFVCIWNICREMHLTSDRLHLTFLELQTQIKCTYCRTISMLADAEVKYVSFVVDLLVFKFALWSIVVNVQVECNVFLFFISLLTKMAKGSRAIKSC